MSANRDRTIFIGNLDDRVTERVLYDILIQAGRVIDLYIPRDRETDRQKGIAFAEYESEEIADYAVKLFSGLVTLYNRTLRFAISGQDKPTPGSGFRARQPIDTEESLHSAQQSSYTFTPHRSNYGQVPPPPGLANEHSGYRSYSDRYVYSGGRHFGSASDNVKRSSYPSASY